MTEEKKKSYFTKFDEIDALANELIIENIGENREERAKRIKDETLDILIEMYLLGYQEANEMLGFRTIANLDAMYESIFKVIAGKTWEDRIDDYILTDQMLDIAVVINTEAHRVFNNALSDSANRLGNQVYKTWITMRDDKVRETHDYLEGMKIPLDDLFYTYDGDSAKYPGDFTDARNNVNCRCVIDLSK